MKHIEQFENETFWDELIERLSWRDLICKYGKKAVLEMDIHTKREKQEEFRKKYALEFEKNGVNNLKLTFQLTN